ncbi:MAG: hypothetical protein DRP47_10895 [Candidatus Zixiibacteriota bacterium]|nr:MAG: hypothetical protein DRP47_10895 [candidate division Zixibacteria bacterium]
MASPEDKFLQQLAKGEIENKELIDKIGRIYEWDRAIAACLQTTPDIQETLSKSCDQETRRQVICNVITPTDVLITLAPQFPQEFFSHPLLDFFILEDPKFLSRLEPGVLKVFLSDPECPEGFVLWACRYGNKTDQLAILKRSDIKVEWLQLIARWGVHPKPAEKAMDRLIVLGKSWL